MTVHGHVSAVPVDQPVESVPLPPGIGRRPSPPGAFVGRVAELARLDAAAAGRGAVVAVHGPGGVGKSALVARFAGLRADRFAPVWWITADSAGALRSGLAEFALALTPRVAGLGPAQRAESGVRWLASHDGWLLVLDDVTDPAHAALLSDPVRTGTVVVTSRVGGWRGTATVAVDPLPRDEVVELLCRLLRQEWPEADLTGAAALCDELGGQPAAIDRAAAHLARHRLPPSAYLARLARFPGWTPAASSDSVPLLVARFHASPDHEERCRIVWELARSGTTAAREALRSLTPRHAIEQLTIREALEF
ncbi:hypothetical protein IOD16_21945 [Saccharothrix sp. 6-C]|uniref:hypothetical protein n=1 Tax=Saccharothrix sp. 6-C TaxID=2781735 RepID=UPI0019175F70|nr:hypothetical protein [Saccharothrix sp. 6-C]QQQ73903.1 hypothetical protein IOD16_21945 [Saccharothrix sp. 6-C]